MKTRDRKLIELLINRFARWVDDYELVDMLEGYLKSTEYLQFCKDNPVQDIQSNELPKS